MQILSALVEAADTDKMQITRIQIITDTDTDIICICIQPCKTPFSSFLNVGVLNSALAELADAVGAATAC